MFAQTVAKAIEEPLRIPSAGVDLYAMLHHPAGVSRGAVLLCPADGEERAWCLRTYVELARTLAERGFWTLRFDYTGQGESAGAYEDAAVAARIADIGAVLDVFRERSGEASPALVGVRLGATLALEAAARDPQIDCVVLWEPVLDGAGYARNLVRINLAMQMVMHKKVIRTTEQLMEDLAVGGRVSANGYNLTKPFLDSLEALRPAERLSQSGGRVLVVTTPAARLPESPAVVKRLQFAPFWKEPKADMTPPRALISDTVEWLEAQLGGRVR
jgi:alpha/beta superfamily hydrolase